LKVKRTALSLLLVFLLVLGAPLSGFAGGRTVYTISDNFPHRALPELLQYHSLKIDSGELRDGRFTKVHDSFEFVVDVKFSKMEGTEGNEYHYLDWESNFPVSYVFVKGGKGGGGFLYKYDPTVTEDEGLTALMHSSEKPHGISHVTFYYKDKEEEETGSIVIIKRIVDEDGIDILDDATEFDITVSGLTLQDSKISIEKDIVITKLPLGSSYTIDELFKEGYRLVSIVEQGTLAATSETSSKALTVSLSESKPIVYVLVTNMKLDEEEEEKGNLTIKKILLDTNGNVVTASFQEFNINVAGGSNYSVNLRGGQQDSREVPLGTYTITESVPSGYRLVGIKGEGEEGVGSSSYTFTLHEENRSAVVIVTNQIRPYIPPPPDSAKLIIKKVLIDQEGKFIEGNTQDFTVNITGNSIYNATLKPGQSDARWLNLGSYTVKENSVPVGYNLFTVKVGEYKEEDFLDGVQTQANVSLQYNNQEVLVTVVNQKLPIKEEDKNGDKDKDIVIVDPIPDGPPNLPDAGNLPSGLFYGIGMLMTTAGFGLKARRKI
jgi:hypothetical protein